MISPAELKQLINEAVREALISGAVADMSKKGARKEHIKGIKGLQEFLHVSHSHAQKLKNSGIIPFSQFGKTILFDPDKVLQAMSKYNETDYRTKK